MKLSNPLKKTTDLDFLRARKIDLTKELSGTQIKIAQGNDRVVTLLKEGAARDAVRKAQSELTITERDAADISEAISQIDTEIKRLVAEEARALDGRLREKSIGRYVGIEAEINEVGLIIANGLKRYATLTDLLAPNILGAHQLNSVANRLAAEFPEVVATTTAMIRTQIASVRDGTACATFIEPGAPAGKANSPKPPETQMLVAVRNLAWCEGDMLRRHPKGWPVSLPVELAKHAMALHAALPPGAREASAASNSPSRTRDLPALSSCVTLDAESAKAKAEALAQSTNKDETSPASSTFQTVNRGPQLFGRATLN